MKISELIFINNFRSERSDVRRGGQSYILPCGQERLHDVLYVRGRAQTSHALSRESGLQSQRERLRLAGECRGLFAAHAGAACVKGKRARRRKINLRGTVK